MQKQNMPISRQNNWREGVGIEPTNDAGVLAKLPPPTGFEVRYLS